jgi:hypothetical protein
MNIRNGTVGLWADTVFTPDIPVLTIRNTRIDNMSSIGIMGQGTSIHASNTSISNCGQLAIFLNIGGSYEFYHCSVGNYWNTGFSNRTTPSLVMKDYYEDVNGGINIRPIGKAYFGNCIIWGNKEFEILSDEHPDSEIPFLFDHCLIKADPEEFDLGDPEHFINVINLEDPKFIDPANSLLALDTLSPAKDRALTEIAEQYPLDIEGQSRVGGLGPDLGAFERVENDSIFK